MISRVKGTQDWLDLSLVQFVLERMRAHLYTYHFHEISTPIIEPLDLFKRSLGTHTDVVTKEMFVFETAGGDQICLRPEMTASTVRAFLENSIQTLPWKVFSYGPLFRYERPQKGRYRQFHQMNIEMIGAASYRYDVELIMMLDRFFNERLQLNNYALLINYLGCAADRAAYRTYLQTFLYKLDTLCDTCLVRREKNPLRVFDCKNQSCQALYQNLLPLTDYLCAACVVEWQGVQESLSLLSISYTHAPKLVRGLDYYDKTAFEFVSENLGAQTAFCGGGRYNSLVSQLSGKRSEPAIGAAIGMERLLLLLEPIKDTLGIPKKRPLHVIAPLEGAQHMMALFVADMLRAAGLCVDLLLDESSIKHMMRKADKLGADYVVIIGSDEQLSGTVTLKSMATGIQETVAQVDLVVRLLSA